MHLRVAVDSIVFGPLMIPRHVMGRGMIPRPCQECPREITEGEPYGWLNNGAVCEPCADRLEAEHR
ncbi:hypothetical protein [Streptomyces sp. NBC_00687]|uniref:hypothetical protein n=1 Tax=Streptomyces sp. NBC_00687 TaxID=2975807 RepID=UPI00225A9443|nr:hypothetical protein [Streptomyces sp. NBC_00687]MCX4912845.1 hypothetical protein [Streptomyces sp. NBC_00687]